MLCAIAKLDEAATQKLLLLQKAAIPDSAVWRPLYGHITIAAYTGKEEEEFIRFCKESLSGFSSFSVKYRKIEVLEETSVIAAVPEKTGLPEAAHKIIAEQYSNDLDDWTGTDRWLPHTTLFFGPGSDLKGICSKMTELFVPFSASVISIEFSRVLANGYEIIDRLPLFD